MKHVKAMLASAVAMAIAVVESVKSTLAFYTSEAGLIAFLNLYSQFTFDAALLLKAAALVGATANGTLILDLGNGVVDGFVVVGQFVDWYFLDWFVVDREFLDLSLFRVLTRELS